MPPWPASRAAIASTTASRAGPSSISVPSPGVVLDAADGLRERRGARGEDEAEGAVRVHAHQALVPAPRPADELADRQGVQELVGDQQQRPVARQARRLVVPLHRQPGQERRLPLAQGRAGLDQMDAHGGGERGHHPRRPQRVGHQRAAPGPELDHGHPAGPPEIEPVLHQRQADQLAEQLADLRRGDEVAGGAQRIAARIVARHWMGQGQRHVAGDRDRAVVEDQPAQAVLERAHPMPRPAAGRARTRKMPKASIGSERSWPMVMPPAR